MRKGYLTAPTEMNGWSAIEQEAYLFYSGACCRASSFPWLRDVRIFHHFMRHYQYDSEGDPRQEAISTPSATCALTYQRICPITISAEEPGCCDEVSAEGRYTFAFDPDELIEEFLLSNNRKSKKFLRLKTEHFYVAAYVAYTHAQLLQQFAGLKSHAPEVETYRAALDRLLVISAKSEQVLGPGVSNRREA